MARKAKRHGLGSTSEAHRTASKSYAAFLVDAINLAESDIKHGSCRAALRSIVTVSRASGGVSAHRSSVSGRGKALRSAYQSKAMSDRISKLQEKFFDKCVKK